MSEEWGEYKISSGKRTRSAKPLISINKNGVVGFNSAFCKFYLQNLGELRGVEIYFFEKVSFFAFKLIFETKSENMIKANILNKVSFNISASSFFVEIGKRAEDLSGKYSPNKKEIEKIGEVYYIDLNKKS